MTRARPLRVLALIVALWVGARAIMLAMPAAPERHGEGAVAVASSPARPVALPPATAEIRPEPYGSHRRRGGLADQRARAAAGTRLFPVLPEPPPPAVTATWPVGGRAEMPLAQVPPVPPPSSLPFSSRWSGSAWLLVRGSRGQAALAPGGTLGGSQAGARLLYRLGGGVSLSGRFYVPLRRLAGAEAAAGIDWQPFSRVPVHFLAERRQDLGGSGRSAFALTAYGGASRRLPAGLRGEAYLQAGLVGIRSRDLFIDGSVRLSAPLGRIEIGGSAWAAAQPGAARLDAGPSLSYRLPVRGTNARVQADWRFRIAGDAAPGSGPALTVASDF